MVKQMQKAFRMNGLDNEFLIFDGRRKNISLTPSDVIRLSDEYGIDQLIIIEQDDETDAFMRIYNQDSGEVSACGNAARCVAWLLMQENGASEVTIHTHAGILHAVDAGEQCVKVNMGTPKLKWDQIPVAERCDTLHMPYEHGAFRDPVGVNVGNPHAVFFVNNLSAINVAEAGAPIEVDSFFPEHVNVNFAEVVDRNNVKLHVFERGVGPTQACGTGACATGIAAIRRGLTEHNVNVHLPGGSLLIEWSADDADVHMTGSVSLPKDVEVTL